MLTKHLTKGLRIQCLGLIEKDTRQPGPVPVGAIEKEGLFQPSVEGLE